MFAYIYIYIYLLSCEGLVAYKLCTHARSSGWVRCERGRRRPWRYLSRSSPRRRSRPRSSFSPPVPTLNWHEKPKLSKPMRPCSNWIPANTGAAQKWRPFYEARDDSRSTSAFSTRGFWRAPTTKPIETISLGRSLRLLMRRYATEPGLWPSWKKCSLRIRFYLAFKGVELGFELNLAFIQRSHP